MVPSIWRQYFIACYFVTSSRTAQSPCRNSILRFFFLCVWKRFVLLSETQCAVVHLVRARVYTYFSKQWFKGTPSTNWARNLFSKRKKYALIPLRLPLILWYKKKTLRLKVRHLHYFWNQNYQITCVFGVCVCVCEGGRAGVVCLLQVYPINVVVSTQGYCFGMYRF